MTTRRGYSNVARTLYVTNPLDAAQTTSAVTVAATPGGASVAPVGWPTTFPYFAVIDKDKSSEEVVLVTSLTGNTLTVTRANALAGDAFGSLTRAHSPGATIDHMATATDYAEANGHINSSVNVHGIGQSSQVVGTTDTQTLTNKTLADPVVTGGTATGTRVVNGTLDNPSFTNAKIPGASVTGKVPGALNADAISARGLKVTCGNIDVAVKAGTGSATLNYGYTYDSPPAVICQARTGSVGNLSVGVTDAGTRTTTVNVFNDAPSVTSRSVWWIAIGP